MLHSKEWRKTWSNVQGRLLFLLMTAAMLQMLALPGLADGKGRRDAVAHFDLGLLTLQAKDKSVYPQSVDPMYSPMSFVSATPDPFVIPKSVDIQVPTHVSSDLETGFNVFVSMPTGCYRSRIKVEHIDDFTHRLTPMLMRDDKDCVRYSRYEHQVVSLGQLLPGQHEIVVDNTTQPISKKIFWVNEADLSASTKSSRHLTGS